MANKSSIVSWDAVAGAADYQVVVVDSDGNANLGSPILNTFQTGGSLSAVGADVFGILAGGNYRIQVRALAVNPAENSDFSDVVNAVYDPKLEKPTNVQVT